MTRELALVATLLVGALVALQAPANSVLGRSVGTFGASSINFAVGTAILLVIALLVGQLSGARAAQEPPAWWYYVLGGVCGAAYVTSVLITVRWLGATGVTAATIAGQLGASLVVDRLGVLGLEPRPVSLVRVAGVALLVAGTVLVVRD